MTTTGVVLTSCVLTSNMAAQVGNSPQSSPYRDIRKGHTITAIGGYFGGDGGTLGIGPHDGPLYGGRYDIRTGGTVQLGLGIIYGDLERFIVNPYVPEAERRTGPVKQSVTFAEVDLQFNLTGGKSWHRFAPFIGASGGLAISSNTPADTSGFDFGNKFFFAPVMGTRIFLSNRLHLRGEARPTFWKLVFPVAFRREPTIANPNPVVITTEFDEWDTSWWFQVGLGYSFSP